MMERLRHGALLLALAYHIVGAQPVPAPTKLVGAQGAWWILDDEGRLRSFDGRRTVAQRLSGPVRDIARSSNGELLALIELRKMSHAVVMEHVASGTWREFANLVIEVGDPLIGLAVSDTSLVIVSSRAIYSVRPDGSGHRQPIHGLTIREGLQPASLCSRPASYTLVRTPGSSGED